MRGELLEFARIWLCYLSSWRHFLYATTIIVPEIPCKTSSPSIILCWCPYKLDFCLMLSLKAEWSFACWKKDSSPNAIAKSLSFYVSLLLLMVALIILFHSHICKHGILHEHRFLHEISYGNRGKNHLFVHPPYRR